MSARSSTIRLAVPRDTNFDSQSNASRIDVFRLRALSVLTDKILYKANEGIPLLIIQQPGVFLLRELSITRLSIMFLR